MKVSIIYNVFIGVVALAFAHYFTVTSAGILSNSVILVFNALFFAGASFCFSQFGFDIKEMIEANKKPEIIETQEIRFADDFLYPYSKF